MRIRESNESVGWNNRPGMLCARYTRYYQAEEAFLRIVQSQKYHPALVNLGNLHSQREELDKALECCERAYRIDGNKPRLPMHLPETCYCLGMPKETEKYFRRLQDPEGIVKALLPGCPAVDVWSRSVQTCGTAAGVVRCR
jgi:tetratricopeptide (TPR) repeat protein